MTVTALAEAPPGIPAAEMESSRQILERERDRERKRKNPTTRSEIDRESTEFI